MSSYDELRACVRLRQVYSYVKTTVRRIQRELRDQPENERLTEMLELQQGALDELERIGRLLNQQGRTERRCDE